MELELRKAIVRQIDATQDILGRESCRRRRAAAEASFDAIHKALAFVRQGEYEDLARWCEVKRKEAIIRAKAGEDYARLEKMGISVDLDRFQFDL